MAVLLEKEKNLIFYKTYKREDNSSNGEKRNGKSNEETFRKELGAET